jgi:hypothetical protein
MKGSQSDFLKVMQYCSHPTDLQVKIISAQKLKALNEVVLFHIADVISTKGQDCGERKTSKCWKVQSLIFPLQNFMRDTT